MWECYCFSSQASMMSTSLNTPFQGFWSSCENVPGTNSCMTFLSRPDLLYVLSSNICGKQINASGMYGREWTLFRGKQCHRDTAALSAPTCPAYLCSSSLNALGQGPRIQVIFSMKNEVDTTHTSHRKAVFLQSRIFLWLCVPCQAFSFCFLTRPNAGQSDSHCQSQQCWDLSPFHVLSYEGRGKGGSLHKITMRKWA